MNQKRKLRLFHKEVEGLVKRVAQVDVSVQSMSNSHVKMNKEVVIDDRALKQRIYALAKRRFGRRPKSIKIEDDSIDVRF